MKSEVEAAAAAARKAYDQFGQWLTDRPRAAGAEPGRLRPRGVRAGLAGLPRRRRRPRRDVRLGLGGARPDRGRDESIAAALNGGDRSIAAVAELLDDDPARKIHGKEAFRDWMQRLADAAVAELAGTHFDIPDEIGGSSA